MRASLSFCCIVAFAALVSPALAQKSGTSADVNASCRIPFETLKDSKTGEPFPLGAALNENDKLPDNLRHRYIVGDFNSADENGLCRGVEEYFTPASELSEFPRLRAIAAVRSTAIALLANESVEALLASEKTQGDPDDLALELEDLKNYLDQVHRYKTNPFRKAGVVQGYCVGQTLSFCEIVDGQPKLVFRFVTSSSKWLPKPNQYYAPINVINARSWASEQRYTPADARRDARMGGGSAKIAMFENGGDPIEMPNFMHFLPMEGYKGERQNGIHQIAGGLDSGGMFGAPVSLGCIRLSRFQAKLARWWTPRQAKFFVYFEPNQYRNHGDAKTGKAKPYVAPPATTVATTSPRGLGLFSFFFGGR